jgi:predicted HAD superfamily phosphohydrolase YqeG
LILDKDDTLTSLHSFTVQDHSISSTIEKLKNKNIGLFVLSNSIKLGDPSEIEGIQILRLGKKKPFNEE